MEAACHFCHDREQSKDSGELLKLPDDSVIAHYKCMLFSPKAFTSRSSESLLHGFNVESVKKEIKRGKTVKCSLCKEFGGTIGCNIKVCRRTYHYSCVKEAGGKYIEDRSNERYEIYCSEHKDYGNRESLGNFVNIAPNGLEEDEDGDDDENSKSADDKLTSSAKKRKRMRNNTGFPRKRRRTHSKVAAQDENNILPGNGYNREMLQNEPSTSSNVQPGTSGSNSDKQSDSETDAELYDEEFNSTSTGNEGNIVYKHEPCTEHSPSGVVETSPCSGHTDSNSTEQSSLDQGNLLSVISLSRKWMKQEAMTSEHTDSVTPDVKAVLDKFYYDLGGSFPSDITAADEIGNGKDVTMTESFRCENPPADSKEHEPVTNTLKIPPSHPVEPFKCSAVQIDIGDLNPSGFHDVQVSSIEPLTSNVNDTVTPQITNTIKVEHTSVTPPNSSHDAKETQQKSFPNAKINLLKWFPGGSDMEHGGTLLEPPPSISPERSTIIAQLDDSAEANGTAMAQNANSSTGIDKLELQSATNSTEKSKSVGKHTSSTTQENISETITSNSLCKPSVFVTKDSLVTATEDLSCPKHVINNMNVLTPVNPEIDVSSINLGSSQNAELFIRYKKIKETMSNVGVNAGLCKKFWDICQEKHCVELFLKNIKRSIELITEKIREGKALEQEYGQAFMFLMGSSYLEGIMIKEKEEIQQRIQCIEEEKEELSKKVTFLTDLLTSSGEENYIHPEIISRTNKNM
ncbi:PHD finger 6 [Pelobates cultripes]|uniref:PHD finger 6 n=1 Tax=Pelobates cultripes TaxID=61616 RepID=A0AAD1R6R6_PELCU|nr:PHD finger 6 [Pelobates cultripes]